MLNKKIAAIVAASGMAVTGLAFSITPAKAFDPVSNSYAIVGSDTLEDAVGALANGFQGVRTTTSQSSAIGSFDATGSGTIITKPNGIRFERPNGSGDGRKALESIINGTTFTASAQPFSQNVDTQFIGINLNPVGPGAQVDISRGSSGGTVDNTATGVLARYTFGRDAIAYAYGSGLTNNPGNINAATMKLIYQCDSTALGNYGITHAVIPQAGSGTRKDFLSKLGITDDSTFTSGSCITVGQEHDASTLGANDIMPMSASRWIAMNNGVSYKRIAAGVQLGSLVTGVASVSGTAGNMKPVVAYYKDLTWGRDTYLFVDKRRVQTPQALHPASAVSTGSTTITLASTAGIVADQIVTGTGIASATKVANVGLSVSPAASVAKGAFTVTVADASSLAAGNAVGGAAIAGGTTIASISGNTVTLSAATTAAMTTSSTISFDNGQVTLNKATTGSIATTDTVTFASPMYDAVLAALFNYDDETSLTYQGGSTFSYANMTDANYPAPLAYQASYIKLLFGFLPASVQDKQFAHN